MRPATPTPAAPRPVTSGSALPTPTREGAAALFELVLEATGDGLLDWDLASGGVAYSLRWKMLLGYEDHELAETPELWRRLSHPEDLPQVEELLRDHLESFWPFAASWRMRHRNGEWRWILCRAITVRDGGGIATRLLAIFTDINDQVRAEERQKALTTALPDLMLRLRTDGLVLDEKRASGAVDLLAGPGIGQPLFAVARAGEWAQHAVALVREAVESGGVMCRECAGAEAAPGSPAPPAALELRAVKSGDQEAVCIIRDITERKQAERRERELQERIEQMHRAEKDRLAGELEIAAHIQTALLPAATPISNLEVCGKMLPATEVGGDYFDVIPCPDGAWLAIGDVSGHGLNAGMIMLMVQSAIACRVHESHGASPREVIRSVNSVLFQNIRGRLRSDEFVTLTLLRYWDDGRIAFAGAHEDMLIFRAATGAMERIGTPGTWLGVIAELEKHIVTGSARLHPGDLLVLHTDGITEARAADNEQFGIGRLADAVRERIDRPVSEIPDHVIASAGRWARQQDDDMSLVVARYRPR
jgi:PAS domain S-box-containing protein